MRSRRFEPALRGISEEHVLAVVADVTDISVPTLRGPLRGGPAAEARCLAGYVGKRLGGISLGAMARHLGREESYLLKRVSALEKTLAQAEQSDRL